MSRSQRKGRSNRHPGPRVAVAVGLLLLGNTGCRHSPPPSPARDARPDPKIQRLHKLFAKHTAEIPARGEPPSQHQHKRGETAGLPDGFLDTGRTTTIIADGAVSLRGFGTGSGTDDTDAGLLDYTFQGRQSWKYDRETKQRVFGSVWTVENRRAGIPRQAIDSAEDVGGMSPRSPFFPCRRTIGPLRLGTKRVRAGSVSRWFADGNTAVTWNCPAAYPSKVTRRYLEKRHGGPIAADTLVRSLRIYAKVPYQSQPATLHWPDTVRFRRLRLNGALLDTRVLQPENTHYVMRGVGAGAADCTAYRNIYTYRRGITTTGPS